MPVEVRLGTPVRFVLQGGTVDECWALRVLHSLRGRSLFFPALLSLRLPSRTLLHLAAALGFLSLTEFLLFWRADFPLIREFDPFAIDLEGKTPLHYAVAASQSFITFLHFE